MHLRLGSSGLLCPGLLGDDGAIGSHLGGSLLLGGLRRLGLGLDHLLLLLQCKGTAPDQRLDQRSLRSAALKGSTQHTHIRFEI